MIFLLYAHHSQIPDDYQGENLELPAQMRQRILRFQNPMDQKARWLSLLLLQQAYAMAFKESVNFHLLHHDSMGRPFLQGVMWDFNLSHSGDWVVLCWSYESRVGVDLEKINPSSMDLSDFEATMTAQQWQKIYQHSCPWEKFLEYWTAKESALKADGRGLSLPLKEIVIDDIHETEYGAKIEANYQGQKWSLYQINFIPGHSGHIAYCGRDHGEKRQIVHIEVKNG